MRRRVAKKILACARRGEARHAREKVVAASRRKPIVVFYLLPELSCGPIGRRRKEPIYDLELT